MPWWRRSWRKQIRHSRKPIFLISEERGGGDARYCFPEEFGCLCAHVHISIISLLLLFLFSLSFYPVVISFSILGLVTGFHSSAFCFISTPSTLLSRVCVRRWPASGARVIGSSRWFSELLVRKRLHGLICPRDRQERAQNGRPLIARARSAYAFRRATRLHRTLQDVQTRHLRCRCTYTPCFQALSGYPPKISTQLASLDD